MAVLPTATRIRVPAASVKKISRREQKKRGWSLQRILAATCQTGIVCLRGSANLALTAYLGDSVNVPP